MADQLETPNVVISYVAVNGAAQAIVFNQQDDRRDQRPRSTPKPQENSTNETAGLA